MPLQRRLPKRGFVSAARFDVAEIRLSDLAKVPVARHRSPRAARGGSRSRAGEIGQGHQGRRNCEGGEAFGHRRHQGRQGGNRSRRRQRRVSGGFLQDRRVGSQQPGPEDRIQVRRSEAAALVPAGRARRLSGRDAHPGAGHQRVGAGRAVPFSSRAGSSASSTCSPAARCSGSRSWRSGSCRTFRRRSSCSSARWSCPRSRP